MSVETNKAVVRRFNEDVIEQGSESAFRELMDTNFVNHSAPLGMSRGAEGMWNTFQNVLRPALSEFRVLIHQQIGENDLVTTRKSITGRHTGKLLGVAPTDKQVSIDVIDIVRIFDGRYLEHWGVNTLTSVLAQLKG